MTSNAVVEPGEICEACERAPVEIIDPCDDETEPYRVCPACHQRLQARSLRPVEWYNLAKRHGWFTYLLHDDFYEEDGAACQPHHPVENPEAYPIPTLAEVAQDPRSLLNYSITRWNLRDEVLAAWQLFRPAETMDVLAERYASTSNAGIRSCILEIYTATRGEPAADFVRRCWDDYPQSMNLISLSDASAACLPLDEGFRRVTAALAELPTSRQRQLMYCLGKFHSPAALDWIEQNYFPPATDAWGSLAASSGFDWPHAVRWLEAGRPLSQLALSALEMIIRRRLDGDGRGPGLQRPPTRAVLEAVLTEHARRDPRPAVVNVVEHLREHAALLTGEREG